MTAKSNVSLAAVQQQLAERNAALMTVLQQQSTERSTAHVAVQLLLQQQQQMLQHQGQLLQELAELRAARGIHEHEGEV